MSRVQLALNVSDLDAAVDFYSKLFGAEPAKRRPGYANFAVADPPLTKDAIAGRIRRLLAMADKRAEDLGIPNTEANLTPEMLADVQ